MGLSLSDLDGLSALSLEDLEALGAQAPKAGKGRNVRAGNLDRAHRRTILLPDESPKPLPVPVSIHSMFKRWTCACGAEFRAPLYGDQMTWLRLKQGTTFIMQRLDSPRTDLPATEHVEEATLQTCTSCTKHEA